MNEGYRKKTQIFKRCESTYYDSLKHETIRCHRSKGHEGNHRWFSFFWFMPNECEYVWDDSVAIKGN